MALLITLAVIGGIAAAVGLYLLGVELIRVIVSQVLVFKEKTSEYIEEKRAARKAKKQQRLEKQIEKRRAKLEKRRINVEQVKNVEQAKVEAESKNIRVLK